MAGPVSRRASQNGPKLAEPQASLADLVPNARNPRKPWTVPIDQLVAFRASLIKFGDLGGIVRNLETNQLIGGHKRVEAFSDGRCG